MKCFFCDNPAVTDDLCAEHIEQMMRCGLCGGNRDTLEIFHLNAHADYAIQACSWCCAELDTANREVVNAAVRAHLAARGVELVPWHTPYAKNLGGLRAAMLEGGVIADADRTGPSPHARYVAACGDMLRAMGHDVVAVAEVVEEKERATLH